MANMAPPGGKSEVQTLNETKSYFFDVSPRLTNYAVTPTLSSATSRITNPAGTTTSSTTSPSVSGTVVRARIQSSELGVAGTYLFEVLATLSNSDTCAAVWWVMVPDLAAQLAELNATDDDE